MHILTDSLINALSNADADYKSLDVANQSLVMANKNLILSQEQKEVYWKKQAKKHKREKMLIMIGSAILLAFAII